MPDGVANSVPWAADALSFLDRRRQGGAAEDCPLPDLFAALLAGHDDLSIADFHEGLRRLHEGKAVRLLPSAASLNELPQPEFALFDRAGVFYYVAR